MTPATRQPAILCIENNRSQFAASQELLASGEYDVITATSSGGATAVLRAMPRIKAAVLPCGEVEAKKQLRLAATIEEVRPGLPKIAVATRPENLTSEALHLCWIARLQLLRDELRRLVAAGLGKSVRANMLAQASFDLQVQSERLLMESLRLVKQARERTGRFRKAS